MQRSVPGREAIYPAEGQSWLSYPSSKVLQKHQLTVETLTCTAPGEPVRFNNNNNNAKSGFPTSSPIAHSFWEENQFIFPGRNSKVELGIYHDWTELNWQPPLHSILETFLHVYVRWFKLPKEPKTPCVKTSLSVGPRVPRYHANLIKVWLRFVVLNIPLKIHSCKVCTCFAQAASFVAAVTGLKHFLWNACQLFLPHTTVTMQ